VRTGVGLSCQVDVRYIFVYSGHHLLDWVRNLEQSNSPRSCPGSGDHGCGGGTKSVNIGRVFFFFLFSFFFLLLLLDEASNGFTHHGTEPEGCSIIKRAWQIGQAARAPDFGRNLGNLLCEFDPATTANVVGTSSRFVYEFRSSEP